MSWGRTGETACPTSLQKVSTGHVFSHKRLLAAGDVNAAVGRGYANCRAARSKRDANLLRPFLSRRREFRNIAVHPAIGCAGLQARRVGGRHSKVDASIDRVDIEALAVPTITG